MRKKVIIAIIAVGLLVTGSAFVIAQKAMHKGHGPFAMGRHGGPMFGMLRGLDLTAEQKAAIKEVSEAGREGLKPLFEQLKANHDQLAALGTDGKFDQARVETLAAEQAGIMSKLIVEKEKAKAAIFAVLTDEQKAKAVEMQQKRAERMKNHGPMGGKHDSVDKE